MEKISGVSDDELLVKILSFVPTKVAVSTSVLSKRWKYLWKRVPKLEFSDIDTKPSNEWQNRLRRFIIRNLLPLHQAPVLESLQLKFSTHPFQPDDIQALVEIALSRGVRELSIAYSSTSDILITELPSCLYTCNSLVSLKLERVYVDVPDSVCLPYLKTLLLRHVRYQCENSLQQLLPSCPVLEDLTVEQCVNFIPEERDSGLLVVITCPSLKRLNAELPVERDSPKVVIKSPSLKYFKVMDHSSRHSLRSIENMPELEEADIDIRFWNIGKFLTPATSVKRLSLCLTVGIPKPVGRVGIIFRQLEHLKLCTCDTDWSNLLFRFLRDSRKLRHLELYVKDEHDPVRWHVRSFRNREIYVPECFLIRLETFKWTGYEGISEQSDIVRFILNSACFLKTATMVAIPYYGRQEKEEMMYDFRLMFRASPTCKLAVD